jgi:ATP phosphoribosyltransferase
MSDLMLALPSKGRLEAATRQRFAKAGLNIERPGGARSYLGRIAGQTQITVRFLSAGEIAGELIRGNLDVWVTGQDLVHEGAVNGPEMVIMAHPLGFGGANVVLGVPDAWIDVIDMRDLADVASDFRHTHGRWLRIATKYVNLTRRFFARNGIAEYRIVQSLGATEAAPASGAADLIVDITSTGATLGANGLKILSDGLILSSEACLTVAKGAIWTGQKRRALSDLLDAFEPGLGSQIVNQLTE